MGRSLSRKFWFKVDKQPNYQCWEWTGSKSTTEFNGGYGKMTILLDGKYRTKQATHVAWYLEHGHWPKHQINHTCDNPGCVRHDHLFEGTQSDNAKDAYRKGRLSRWLDHHHGADHPNAKLSEKDVIAIRRRYRTENITQQQLADDFDVGQTRISELVLYKSWKYV